MNARCFSTPLALLIVGLTAAAAPTAAAPPTPLPKVRVAPDGRRFVTETGRPFVPFGVNYYRPGTGWAPQVWKQFDADATRRDFARLKELGGNCVRVFLTYGSFCTNAGQLQAEGLARFDQFLDLAEAAGLYVHPTGPDHWEGTPPWARGDRLAGDAHLQGLEAFWKRFAARYRGRHVIFAYDLLNEPSVRWDTAEMRPKWSDWVRRRYGTVEAAAAAWGRKSGDLAGGPTPAPGPTNAPGSRLLLDYQLFREDLADEWTRRQVAAIKSADPDALVTVGFIQWSVPSLLPGVQHYAAFRPARQARLLDFLEIHFYPLARGAYEYAGEEDEVRNLAYLESVVREVAAPGKPVVVAEFGWYGGGKPNFGGGRHPAATEDQQARWNRRLIETTSGLATGWLNWGFHDHPQARDVSELTGLLTVDGRVKAWGREFQRLAAQFRDRPPAPRPPGPRPALDWDRCLTSTRAGDDFRAAYLRAFQADLPK